MHSVLRLHSASGMDDMASYRVQWFSVFGLGPWFKLGSPSVCPGCVSHGFLPVGAQSGQTEGDPNLNHGPKPKTENHCTRRLHCLRRWWIRTTPTWSASSLELAWGCSWFSFGVSPGVLQSGCISCSLKGAMPENLRCSHSVEPPGKP